MQQEEMNDIINEKINELPLEERKTAFNDILYLYNREITKKEEETGETKFEPQYLKELLLDLCRRLVKFRLKAMLPREMRQIGPEDVTKYKRKNVEYRKEDGKYKIYPKTPAERLMLNQIFEKTFLFSFLNLRQRRNFLDCMHPQETKKEEILIRINENGDRLYFLERGRFCVISNNEEKEVPLHTVIGEISLLHNVPRTATVISKERGKVWYLKRESYNTIRLFDQENKWNSFLKTMKEKNYDVSELATMASSVFVEAGHTMKMDGKMLVLVFCGEVRIGGKARGFGAGDIIFDDFEAVSEIEGYALQRR